MLTPRSDLANRIQFTNNLKMITNRSNLICYRIMMVVKHGMENIFFSWGGGREFFDGSKPLIVMTADLLK